MSEKQRKALTGLSLLPIFLISMISIHTTSSMADTITIVADEWSPYNGKPDSEKPGYGIEIAKHVFEEAGHTIIYNVVPWSRAINETRKGNYNAVIGTFKEETPDFIYPEEEFGLSANTFFVKKGSEWKYNGLESLVTVQVGLIKDYSYGERLDAFFGANKNIVQFVYGEDPLLLNIKKLLHGRIDVLIEDQNVLLEKAKTMGVSDQIVKAGKTKDGNHVYIAFSPEIEKSGEYAGIFTKGIRKMKDSGELEKILTKYGLPYWK